MDIFKQQLLAGKIYAKTEKYRKNKSFACDGIKALLENAKNVYVSLSFGKQSICLAHMVYAIDTSVPMFFLASDETWHMYNYKEVIDCFCSRWPIDLHIVQTHRFTNSKSWKSGRDIGDHDLQDMCDRNEWDGWLWGLAKEESRARKITCSLDNTNIHPSIFRYSDSKLRGTPLQNWTIHDIAAYVSDFDIKLLNIYEKFGLEMRTTARITRKARDYGNSSLLNATNSSGFRYLQSIHREIGE